MNNPIACTLETGDFRERVGWIASINQRFLRDHRQTETSLVLSYAPEALSDVTEMVRRERACCAFLAFELIESDDSVELTIRIPEEAQDSADALFAPFLDHTNTTAAPKRCTTDGCGECKPPIPSQDTSHSDSSARGAARWSAVLATGALACGVCCVMPFALPAVALGGAGGVLAWLGSAHAWATTIATIMVIGAWLWIWRRSTRTKAKPSQATLRWMGASTLVLAGAIAWPLIEPLLVRIFSA